MGLELRPGVTLYLARHGETVANVKRRFQGRNDTALTDKGRAEARLLAKILAPRLKGRPLPRFVTSPMPRARTTMEILLDTLHLPRAYGIDDRLMEIDLGAWSGLTDEEAKALDPRKWSERIHDKWNVRVPGGGENYAMVAERIRSWVADLNEGTVAVSHGAFTRIFRGLFANLSWQKMSALDEPQDCVFAFSDGKAERLEYEDGPV
jgi:broad specificity phosphatase PhoE